VWALAAAIAWLALRSRGGTNDEQFVALRTEMKALRDQVGQNLGTVTQQVRAFGDVQRGIGEVREATKQILALGQNIAALEDILRVPKPRGGVGEIMLGSLLEQVLPCDRYCLQHTFDDSTRVDAAIYLADHVVPIDAKFPLDNFQRMLNAEDDKERESARKAFVRDVKRRVDETSKYIRPDAGTFEFAMMYVPAENVYYGVLTDQDLFEYALDRRVIPVSPNSFFAYLNVIVFGLRGLEIEENARELLGQLSKLNKDFDGCQDSFNTLGRHISHAHNKYTDVNAELGRFGDRLSNIAAGAALPSPDDRPALTEG
jgi:DNA recombination protein RmuC